MQEITLKDLAREYNVPLRKARRIVRFYSVKKEDSRWVWPKGSKEAHMVKALLMYHNQEDSPKNN